MQAASGRKPTAFVSYRREDGFILAKYIHDHLQAAGYDVFMDVQNLGAGEFEQRTLAEVAARDYFLLVLTAKSLERMTLPGDWLRKELTQAVKSRRTVIPVLAEDFKFEDQRVQKVLQKLPPALQALPAFNALRIPLPEYFDSAMKRLISFLKVIPDFAPSYSADRPRSTAAVPKRVAQAQSAFDKITLPPMTSLTKTQSTTPWSDLEWKLRGTSVVGVGTPTLKSAASKRLPAPTLMEGILGLTWTKVKGAGKYVLEQSGDAEFKNPGKVVYKGSEKSWIDPSQPLRRSHKTDASMSFWQLVLSKYYRVKAISKDGTGESDWSNIVKIVPKISAVSTRLPAPTLTKNLYDLTWTTVKGAGRYVLEESGDAEFKNPGKVVYQGPETSWMDLSQFRLGGLGQTRTGLGWSAPSKCYRVKAVSKDGKGESDWSNVV